VVLWYNRMDFSGVVQYLDIITFLVELLICLLTYLIPPVTILLSLLIQNIVFWVVIKLNNKTLQVWTQKVVCWYWKLFSQLWHGHEIIGRENIPSSGPALLLYYHGAIPIDYYYLVADTFIKKGRIIHSVVDKFLYKVPSLASLLTVFECETGPRSSCTSVLQAGHILGVSPGGTYEAQLGDNMYKVMWKTRSGFAQVVKDAGGSIPIIPVFTQNVREAYKSFNIGIAKPLCVWLYEKQKIPLVPIYGGFPVKLRTFIGSGITLPSTATIEEIRSASLDAMETLIKSNQVCPGNTFRALTERFI